MLQAFGLNCCEKPITTYLSRNFVVVRITIYVASSDAFHRSRQSDIAVNSLGVNL